MELGCSQAKVSGTFCLYVLSFADVVPKHVAVVCNSVVVEALAAITQRPPCPTHTAGRLFPHTSPQQTLML